MAEDSGTEATSDSYKVESWVDNGKRLHKLLYAGNLQKARSIFAQASNAGRFMMLTIRHGERVVAEWARD